MANTKFTRSSDTRFIIQKLREVEIGEIISYTILADAIAKGVSDLKGPMSSARRVLLREENMVFEAITGVGLRRLSDTQIVGTATRTARHIRRTARRAVQTLSAVSDFSKLDRNDQMRHSAAASVFGAVAEMTTERGITRLQQKIEDKALPFAATLEAFRK